MIPVIDHYLIYNGKSTQDWHAYVDGDGTFKAPERDYEEVEIPGKDGSLLIDNKRYKNMVVSYNGFIVDDFDKNFMAMRDFLTHDFGYHRLEDTYHPDEYRMAAYAGPTEPDVYMLEAGKYTLSFLCKPQRWLKDGEKEIMITGSGKIKNPTLFDAKPKIIVTAGTGAIQINDVTVTLSANSGATVIDCDIQDCYEGLTNRNKDIVLNTGSFPVLSPGVNGIQLASGMTVKIVPRWFIL